MSSLLIDEYPLVVQPSLAMEIGLNEAIVLQQVHYWIEIEKKSGKKEVIEKHFKNGRWWIYNTCEQWQEQFPFWSEKTVWRTIRRLEEMSLLISDNFNKYGYDRTKWYTINYDVLESLVQQHLDKMSKWKETICPDGNGQNDTTNTIDYPTDFNKDFLKGDKGFLRQAKKTTRILEKNIRSVCLSEDLDIDLCTEVILYYMRMYYDYLGRRHPFLNKDNLTSICSKITYGTDVTADLDAESWECLIDQHFNTDYGIEQDWNINFFLCDEVINNRFYEVLY
jgi:hypothetical protein